MCRIALGPGSDASSPSPTPHLLYLGARLPVRSETFVYREVLALRERGYDVRIASVRAPERGLGSSTLEALADEALPVYGAGPWRLLRDAIGCWVRQPGRASRVLAMALRDALVGRDVPLDKRPKLLVQCLAALALDQRLGTGPLDHVHAHMAHVPASIAMYLAVLRQVPFSFTGHAADLFRDGALLPDKLRRAAFVACISDWHRDFYRRQVPELTEGKLPIVRCGVAPVPAADRGVAAAPPSPWRLLAVGRLVEKKGFDDLIAALAAVRDRGAEFHCRIVGDGPQRASLEQQIRAAGLESRVRLEGAQSNDQVQRWLLEADLVVLPCRPTDSGDRDGIPVVLMEAMAAGVAVISGDLPTIRELVRHQQTGCLVPPGAVEPLGQAILQLMTDSALRHRLADAGRRWVEQEFSQAINIQRLTAAFDLPLPQGDFGCREPQPCET
jgi:glycosyltransferase involved in cell wall biosynthesis